MIVKKIIKEKIYNILLIILIIYIEKSKEKKINLRNLISESEIIITINGTGNQTFLNKKQIQINDNINGKKKNYKFDYLPSEILVNGELADITSSCELNLTNEENEITIKFNRTIDNCNVMFYNLPNITKIDLSKFDTSQITEMKAMFYGCSSLSSINLSNLDISSVIDISEIFKKCSSLKSLNLSNFNTSKIKDMEGMFSDCTSLEFLDISKFDTSSVLYMNYMFSNCQKLQSINIIHFDTSLVKNMAYFFNECNNLLSLDLTHFNTSSVVSMSYMFNGTKQLESLDLTNFDTSSVTNMANMFKGCSALLSLNVTLFNTSSVSDMENMFNGCKKIVSFDLKNFDTKSATKMSGMFRGCESLISLDLSNFETSKVKMMDSMFQDCKALVSINLTNFKTSSVKDMQWMFYNCHKLTSLNLSHFDTSLVTRLNGLFYDCKQLVSLDISSFNTTSCNNMGHMFYKCESLISLDLSNFNTISVLYIDNMFKGCINLEFLNILSFNTTYVIKMTEAFSGCKSLKSLDISHFSIYSARERDNLFLNININLEFCIYKDKEDSKLLISYLSNYTSYNFSNNCENISETENSDINSYKSIDSDSKEKIKYKICPENSCLSQEYNLEKCINIKPNMKIFNGICFEGMDEILENLENFKPINTNFGITINGYNPEDNIENLIDKYPNLTFIELGECIIKLKNAYNLGLNTQLFILAIDSPELIGDSSINHFDYEIYLMNGTQLKDLSSCKDIKMNISSKINDIEAIKLNEAYEFSNLGYDIYNKTDLFYTDYCSPASDGENDISLGDRKKYYYPNVSICNEGCEYINVDYEKQRFLCKCNVGFIYVEEEQKQIEENESYLDYCLSLINYKIILCYELFFKFKSFYYNVGFYISFITMLICLLLMTVFWIKGTKKLRVIFYKNIPTVSKLKEFLRKNREKDITIRLFYEEILKKSTKKKNEEKRFSKINNNKNRNKIKDSIENPKSKRSTDSLIKANNFPYKIDNNDIDKKMKIKKGKKTHRLKLTKYMQKQENAATKDKYESFNNFKGDVNQQVEKINIYDKKQKYSVKSIDEVGTEMNIDLHFPHLIRRNDEDIDRKEINNIPYTQALRIDKRTIFQIFISVITNKIGFLNLFFYRQQYSLFSLDISVYLFELLLDLTLNCILYSDDVVSQKFHNNGELSLITSISLSLISNIISSIAVFLLSKLANYDEIFELIIKYVKIQKNYFYNIVRFFKYINIRLGIYFLFELLFTLLMTYYLFIFCSIYHNSQSSIMENYIIGACISLAISVGLTIIITICRNLSIKNHSILLFNISKYLYDHF